MSAPEVNMTNVISQHGFNVIFEINNELYEEEPKFVSLRDGLATNSILNIGWNYDSFASLTVGFCTLC